MELSNESNRISSDTRLALFKSLYGETVVDSGLIPLVLLLSKTPVVGKAWAELASYVRFQSDEWKSFLTILRAIG